MLSTGMMPSRHSLPRTTGFGHKICQFGTHSRDDRGIGLSLVIRGPKTPIGRGLSHRLRMPTGLGISLRRSTGVDRNTRRNAMLNFPQQAACAERVFIHRLFERSAGSDQRPMPGICLSFWHAQSVEAICSTSRFISSPGSSKVRRVSVIPQVKPCHKYFLDTGSHLHLLLRSSMLNRFRGLRTRYLQA